MSTASGAAIAPSLRRLPFTVCLAPSFVNPLLETCQDRAGTPISGLLFGVHDNTTIHVREAYPCPLSLQQFSGTLDGLAALAEGQKKAQSKGLSVVGWYGLRASSGLQPLDIEFHNRQFLRPGDAAILIYQESPSEVAYELYSRSADGVLSEEEHRWGLLRAATGAPLTESAEIAMRSPLRDDFFLRAYSDTYQTDDEARGMALFLPAVKMASRRAGVWLAFALIFGLAAALAFVVIRYNVMPSQTAALGNANSPLGLTLRAEGGRILVTWNRGGLAKSATSGLLLIDDGSQHRTLTLDSSQLANGSVLYTPNSAEVSFLLQVMNPKGRSTSETLRVLDASKESGGETALTLEPLPIRPQTPSPKAAVANRKLPQTLPQAPAGAVNPMVTTPPTTNENEMALGTGARNAIADAPTVAADRPTAIEPSPAQQRSLAETAAPTKSGEAATQPRQLVEEPLAQNRLPAAQEPPVQVPASSSAGPTNALPASYRAPQPVRQIMPDTHFFAPGIIANGGRVEVMVKVDEQGRVTDAKQNTAERTVSSALISSAVRAAREWRFKPATLNGKSVASEHTILFIFNPLKR